MSERYPRSFPRSGGNAGPRDQYQDPQVPVDPTPLDLGTNLNLIKTRSGGYRGTPTWNRSDGSRTPNIGRGGAAHKFVRCDNQDPAGRQEILYMPAALPVWRQFISPENVIYKLNDVTTGTEYGCFKYLGPAFDAFVMTGNLTPGVVAQCGDCDVDHGQAFTVLDCNNNEIKLTDANGEHGNDFFLNDIIEITVDGAQNSVCVRVGEKFDLNAGEDLGFAYTFSRVIGGQNENCTACDILTGYIVKKCGTNDNIYIDDPNGNYQAAWVDQVHEFAPNGGGVNYCAEILNAESGMAIDIQNSNTYTAPGDTWVQLRGGQNDCAVCDDISGYIITPCGTGPNYFLAYAENEAALTNGDVYLFTNTVTGVTECYTIHSQHAAQNTEIASSNQFSDGRGNFVRGIQKANCQACVPVAGCPDSAANNYDAAADGCEVNGSVVVGNTSCCTYPPVNPHKLWLWSPDATTGEFANTGNLANQDAKTIHNCTPVWASDPNIFFIGATTTQQNPPYKGFYVLRKGTGSLAEYKLGYRGDCSSVAYGFGLDAGNNLGANDPTPTNASQVEWQIISPAKQTLEAATAELRALTATGVAAFKVRALKENFVTHPGIPGCDTTCVTIAPGAVDPCLTLGTATCGETIPAHDWDIRAIQIARTASGAMPLVGDVVSISDGTDTIVAQVLEINLKAETHVSGAHSVFDWELANNFGQNPNMTTVMNTIHNDPNWTASNPPCGDQSFEYYKVEVCGAAGQYRWFVIPEYLVDSSGNYTSNPDYGSLSVNDVIAFDGIAQPGVSCGNITSVTVTSLEYDAVAPELKVNFKDSGYSGSSYTDCNDCLNPGGGGGGGGGGGTTIYYEALDCVAQASVELQDSNNNGPFSVGDVVVADDNGNYFCVTITAINIDPEWTPTIEAYTTAGGTCQGCQAYLPGIP